MIPRIYTSRLHNLIKSFPIVVILGPRQCGKTTFARMVLPEWKYQDLERPAHATPLTEDVEARLRLLGDRVIFDEAQQVPPLFNMLRVLVDEDRPQNGRYVLLGSASATLVRSISESLAGRCAFIDMSGFIWPEVCAHGTLDTLWLRGGFPFPFLEESDTLRQVWFESYERTFIERDINLLGISLSAPLLRRLLLMMAHVNAQQWNASELANSLGVSYTTVNRYADILEQVFLIRRIPPYFANIGKRLVKRPKLLFRDSGLLHYLCGITSLDDLYHHPRCGASWESFIIEQCIVLATMAFGRVEAYYWRTAGGAEVDLLLSINGSLLPIEIKRHSSPSASMLRGIKECMKDLNLDRGIVIYPGNDRYSLGKGIEVIGAAELLGDIRRLKQPVGATPSS